MILSFAPRLPAQQHHALTMADLEKPEAEWMKHRDLARSIKSTKVPTCSSMVAVSASER